MCEAERWAAELVAKENDAFNETLERIAKFAREYKEVEVNRKYLAISIKHTEYKWRFGDECVLWGARRTKDDEERCFGGYTNSPTDAELYSFDEFIDKYGTSICCPEPVKMCRNFCQKYKKYDTVLMLEGDYMAYYNLIKG